MSKQPGRRPPSKRRPQARKGRTAAAAKTARKGGDRTSWIIAAIVIAIGGALVFVFASGANNNGGGTAPIVGRQPAPASLVAKVVGVPASVTSKVGAGTATALPQKISGPFLTDTATGKPRIVYLGAEFCPYCATERWAMLNAFSRFGTFKNVKITTSAAINHSTGTPEPYPNTPTFSFFGATYTSQYIKFESVEEENNSDQTLETPSTEQEQLASKYDAPPYVSSANAGAIPFIDFANQYMITGATYDPQVLQGKTHAEIAAALSDPSSDISKGAIGAANTITAAVCKVTKDKPANVCTDPAIQAIEKALG